MLYENLIEPLVKVVCLSVRRSSCIHTRAFSRHNNKNKFYFKMKSKFQANNPYSIQDY